MGVLKLEDLNYTYDDYKLWQGDWELIGGNPLAMSPERMQKHQSTASELIYPDDLVAKVFKLDDKKYDKQGDFTHVRYDFEETTCKVNLDFKKVFARFRR